MSDPIKCKVQIRSIGRMKPPEFESLDDRIEQLNNCADDIIEEAKRLKDENARLTNLIEEHNRDVQADCDAKRCSCLEMFSSRCSDCPLDYTIELKDG